MRDIKFRAFYPQNKNMVTDDIYFDEFTCINDQFSDDDGVVYMQYTGLKDKNGSGLTEIYEGDIISIDGTLKGNIYEDNKEPTGIVIPQLGTKAWANAYKEAMVRGYDYSE